MRLNAYRRGGSGRSVVILGLLGWSFLAFSAESPHLPSESNSSKGSESKAFDQVVESLKGASDGAGFPLHPEELEILFSGPIDQLFSHVRDPFKATELAQASQTQVVVTELEKSPSSSFHLVGITSGPRQRRALISRPDGKVHSIVQGVKIGTLGGFVQKIGDDYVEVVEKVVNPIGEEEVNVVRIGFSEVKN
jgi:hypothetical protein